MPNPRAGTVVDRNDVAKAVGEAKAGRVEFRTDREASVHVPLGKASFGEDQLLDNLTTMVSEIVKAKPSGAKGSYIRSLNIASTMGPGVKLEHQSTLALQGVLLLRMALRMTSSLRIQAVSATFLGLPRSSRRW